MSLCISQKGYRDAETIRFEAVSFASTLKQVLAVAAFAVHAAEAIANFKKLSDISSRGISIEESQHGHMRDVYWPAENQFLAEFVQPTPWESQAVLTDRYAGRMWPPIAAAFARKIHELQCNKPRYCATAFRRALQELLVARAAAKANALTLASQIAFAEVEANDDRDFEQRKQAIALRKGLVAQAAALMASAANGLAAAGSDALRGSINAITAFGYARSDAASDPGFYNTTGRNLGNQFGGPVAARGGNALGNAGSIGGMAGDEAASFTADGVSQGFSGRSAPPGSDSLLATTSMQGPYHAGDANTSTGNFAGGQQQDLARGGIVELLVPSSGGTLRIDFGNLELVDVSHYKAEYAQTGPASLIGFPQQGLTYYAGAKQQK